MVAAVISLRLTLPQAIADRFVSDALILPIAAIVVLVLLARRRPRKAVVDASR
ncbi:hypothetical protein [Frondihabitans sp. PAMC 28766]|uniref:hypothetical protein n=1 Tax=Frondihabitans sp. PAMC 28766 TaxID=1795630 RepID=UPI0012FF787A|nr:hypothetical protein [Frondihabitans sp. PAMC 28766]